MSTRTLEDLYRLTPKQAAHQERLAHGHNTIHATTHPNTRKIRDTRTPPKTDALEMAGHAAMRGATEVEAVNRADIHSKTGGICYLCGRTIHINAFAIDHVIALYRGGTHTWNNLLPACMPCNKLKAAHPVAIEIDTGNALIV